MLQFLVVNTTDNVAFLVVKFYKSKFNHHKLIVIGLFNMH